MKKRLQTVLAQAGVASRRSAAELIESGKVKVDGKVVREKGFRLDAGKHKITVNGKVLPGKERKLHFLFNKPRGVISTVKDTHGRRKITDYFKDIDARLYPVGRLDKNTTGLIIVTNDGALAYKLSHPRYEINKEYIVTVDGPVSDKDIRALEKGVLIEDVKTAPCEIKEIKSACFKIILHEGRKRQIKKMFERVGRKVLELDRVKYAGLTKGSLKYGQYRRLTQKELEKLWKN